MDILKMRYYKEAYTYLILISFFGILTFIHQLNDSAIINNIHVQINPAEQILNTHHKYYDLNEPKLAAMSTKSIYPMENKSSQIRTPLNNDSMELKLTMVRTTPKTDMEKKLSEIMTALNNASRELKSSAVRTSPKSDLQEVNRSAVKTTIRNDQTLHTVVNVNKVGINDNTRMKINQNQEFIDTATESSTIQKQKVKAILPGTLITNLTQKGNGMPTYSHIKRRSLIPEWLEKLSDSYIQRWLSNVDLKTTDTLHLNDSLPFLLDYKNPCWLERIREEHPLLEGRHNFFMNPNGIPFMPQMTKLTRAYKMRYNSNKPFRIRCLPYYLIIGPQKTGTTDLYDKINIHPDMVKCVLKEPHWWSRSRIQSEFNTTLDEYVNLFAPAAEDIANHAKTLDNGTVYHHFITGEATPEIIWDNWYSRIQPENLAGNMTDLKFLTPHHIKAVLPNIKIIAMLRDPVTRLYSDYKYFYTGQNKSIYDFHNKTIEGINWLTSCYSDSNRSRHECVYDPVGNNPPYGAYWNPVVRLRLGMYAEFLVDWLQVFPKEQIKLVRMEDYAEDRLSVLNEIYEFLGLDSLSNEYRNSHQLYHVSNKGSDQKLGKMIPNTKRALEKFYWPYNTKLAEMTGEDKFFWKPKYKN